MNSLSSNSTQARDAAAPKASKQRKQYYIEYPRNFGNEYTIYVVDTPETITWAKEQENRSDGISQTFERVTRKEAVSMAHIGRWQPGRLYEGRHCDRPDWGCGSVSEWLEVSARSLEAAIQEADEFAAEEAQRQADFEALIEAEYERELTRG